MFTESDRVKIRSYMGAASLYKQLFPKLENAINSIQSVDDGGTQVDSSSELLVLKTISELESIEAKIEDKYDKLMVDDAEGVLLNAPRAVLVLKLEGRRKIGTIANVLGIRALKDYFSPAEIDEQGDTSYRYR